MSHLVLKILRLILGRGKMSRSGFTLTELLIAVAIIIVIVSISTLNFLRVTQRAKRAAAASFIAQLEINS